MFQIFAYDFTSVKIESKAVFFLQTKFHWVLTSNSLADNLWARGNWRCNSEGLWLQFRMTLRICKSADESCTMHRTSVAWILGGLLYCQAGWWKYQGGGSLRATRGWIENTSGEAVSKGQPGQRVFEGDKIRGDCTPRYSPTDFPQCPACINLTHSFNYALTFTCQTNKKNI